MWSNKIEDIVGYDNYTYEVICELNFLFSEEKIESRPIKFKDTIIWLDGQQCLHRNNHPAVEKQNGKVEFWVHGVKK